MKATGIVCTVDEMGRFVLPKKLRDQMGLKKLEIFVDGDSIVLKKYEPTCIFCGGTQDILEYCGKKVCPECIAKLEKISEIMNK